MQQQQWGRGGGEEGTRKQGSKAGRRMDGRTDGRRRREMETIIRESLGFRVSVVSEGMRIPVRPWFATRKQQQQQQQEEEEQEWREQEEQQEWSGVERMGTSGRECHGRWDEDGGAWEVVVVVESKLI